MVMLYKQYNYPNYKASANLNFVNIFISVTKKGTNLYHLFDFKNKGRFACDSLSTLKILKKIQCLELKELLGYIIKNY